MKQRDYNGPAAIKVPDSLLSAGFVQVPVLLLRLPDLGLGAKLMYSCLLWYHHRLGYWPGRKAVSHEFGVGERSVVRYLQELEGYGLVLIHRNRQGYIEAMELAPPEAWGRVPNWHPEGAAEESRVSDWHPEEGSGCQPGTLRVPKVAVDEQSWHHTNIERYIYSEDTSRSSRETGEGKKQTEKIPQIEPRIYALIGLARGLLEQGREVEAVRHVLRGYGAGEDDIDQLIRRAQAEMDQ